VSALIDHLPPAGNTYDAALVAALRVIVMYPFNRLNARSHRLDLQSVNRRVHRKAMVTPSASSTRSRSWTRGLTMTSRISRTKAQRLATEARTKAAAYPEISDSIRAYISAYRPAVIDDDTWPPLDLNSARRCCERGTWARRTCARCARRSAATSGGASPNASPSPWPTPSTTTPSTSSTYAA